MRFGKASRRCVWDAFRVYACSVRYNAVEDEWSIFFRIFWRLSLIHALGSCCPFFQFCCSARCSQRTTCKPLHERPTPSDADYYTHRPHCIIVRSNTCVLDLVGLVWPLLHWMNWHMLPFVKVISGCNFYGTPSLHSSLVWILHKPQCCPIHLPTTALPITLITHG